MYQSSHEKEQDLMSIHLINHVKIKCYTMRRSEKRAIDIQTSFKPYDMNALKNFLYTINVVFDH